MSPQHNRLNWKINFFKDVSAENVVDNSLTYLLLRNLTRGTR